MNSYIAFVPARSGSKRLPNKNIKLLLGKPLIVWTLQALINLNEVKEVILSTDSEYYFEVANKFITNPKLKLDLRSADDAGDSIKIFDYLIKYFDKNLISKYENMIMCLPTCPLRKSSHIQEAINLFISRNKAVFSACEYNFPISFAFNTPAQGGWNPVFKDNPMKTGNTRSQDQEKFYRPNGAIYIRKINDFKNHNLKSLYTNANPYIMSNIDSIDIDNEIDFNLVDAILSSHN